MSIGELLILSSLRSKERYGLDIITAVEEMTEGQHKLSLGGLYTRLHRMERKGLIRGRWGESSDVRRGARRRYYRITGLGERTLAEAQRGILPALRFSPAKGSA